MFIKFGNLKQQEYHGIQEMAAYRLHPDVMALLEPYLKKGMEVLDLGCGQGAFSQRLIDAGMIVDGADLDVSQIKAGIRNRYQMDLNKARVTESIPGRYDMIVAMEIIEHLNDPWKYLSDAVSLLRNEGLIVLTTPNISNFISRLRFLMRGSLLAFEKNDLAHGHITPLSFIQLENLFEHYSLKILKKGTVGPVPIFHFYGLSRFTLLRNTILPLLYPFMSGPKNGRALVYILKKG